MTDQVVSRIADGHFARVNQIWQNETAVIIGGGPSLTKQQVDACRGLKCIAVNDAYLLAPWADALYFADSRWWSWQQNGRDGKGMPALGLSAAELTARYKDFGGIKVSISNSMAGIREPHVLFLKNRAEHGSGCIISENSEMIATGSNSCYQALNIAILAGAKRILFLGLDGAARGGRRHWFGDHPNNMDPAYDGIRMHFRNVAPWCRERGIEILNCSPGTVVDCFPCVELGPALAGEIVPAIRDAAPEAIESVYVRVSRLLKAGPQAYEALQRRFSNEPRELVHALRKGLRKGTIIEREGVYRHAEGVVADPIAAVLPG